MADVPEQSSRLSAGPANYSTLEAIQHHPDLAPHSPAPAYSTLEASPRTDEGRFSTLPEASPKPQEKGGFYAPRASPQVDEGRFSTLEAYNAVPESAAKADAMDPEGSAIPPKENWKRRRVCGVPLLFLVIGLVVVLVVVGAVVGGVVGSRSKNDDKAEQAKQTAQDNEASKTATAASGAATDLPSTDEARGSDNPKAVVNQTSNEYFIAPIVYRFLLDLKNGTTLVMQDSGAYNRTPTDGVFLGVARDDDDSYQKWDLQTLPAEKNSKNRLRTTDYLFWMRLVGTDLAVTLDVDVYNSIFEDETNTTRTDIPIGLAPFNPNDKLQMWYLGTPDIPKKKDRIQNIWLWDKPWDLGLSEDSTPAMVLNTTDTIQLWKLVNLTPS